MNPKSGRPRSEEAKTSILQATYELLLEQGFAGVTIEGIAKKAGVSKVTIYKWWQNKSSLALDAFFDATETILPVPDTGSIKEDLFQQVKNLSEFINSPKGKIIAEFIAEGQYDSEFAKEYRSRYFVPRRLISHQIFERGIQRDEIYEDTNIELYTDLIFAPIFYRLLITGDVIHSNDILRIIDTALSSLIKDNNQE
ncbi:transcriptional regulator, TetR family [Anaerosporobacter mobilis DSM 15930]|uniref:Transcriptional regulator, TetR family n=1 Tax=Anaerosporobacter mobilis DSM 15930 TaxID=1120996 RepID=A0A1M7HV39_9FIRM|nr:TetR/AcrR family transcriptional regulator [Anaerosporobacter mobilis]SHM32288.1 transcriptional regulator, TetR family [Anaerosporobacter mobilis DSM 15930]